MENIFVNFRDDEGEMEWPVPVSRVGPSTYRVEEHPDFLTEWIDFGDVFEVERCVDGLRFVRIVEKSHFVCFDFTMGKEVIELDTMQRIFRKAEALGGRWDFLINFLYVYVPEDAEYDPTNEIESVRRSAVEQAERRRRLRILRNDSNDSAAS